MLTLYHAGSSVCSQKARLAFAEAGLAYDSRDIDMTKGEHQTPEYLKLNPNGVVPTLVTEDGSVVRESSVIIEYVDSVAGGQMMPKTGAALWTTRLWLIRCIEIHAAINSLTFASVIREQLLSAMNEQELEAWLQRLANPEIREKRRDLLTNGAASTYVDGAVTILRGVFRDMETALAKTTWLTADTYGLADCALTAYVDRIRRLGMAGLYDAEYSGVAEWLDRARERPSYQPAIQAFYSSDAEARYLAAGQAAWPQIDARLKG